MVLENVTGITGLYGMASYASSSTAGLFWGVICIAIFMISVINLRKNGIDAAVAAASFGMIAITGFLTYFQFISILYPVFFILILGGTLFYMRFKETRAE